MVEEVSAVAASCGCIAHWEHRCFTIASENGRDEVRCDTQYGAFDFRGLEVSGLAHATRSTVLIRSAPHIQIHRAPCGKSYANDSSFLFFYPTDPL